MKPLNKRGVTYCHSFFVEKKTTILTHVSKKAYGGEEKNELPSL